LLPPTWLLKPIPPPGLLENPRWKLFPIPERKKEYGTKTVVSRHTHKRHFFVMNHKSMRHIEISTKTVASEHFSSTKTIKNK